MKVAQEANIFETNNADLASYLIFEGVDLIEIVHDSGNRKIVKMRFLDPHQKCLDLERCFLSSDLKKFRDINKYLLGQIHKKVNQIK